MARASVGPTQLAVSAVDGADVSGVEGSLAAVTAGRLERRLQATIRDSASRNLSALRSSACRSSADISGSRIRLTPLRPRMLGNDSVVPYFGLNVLTGMTAFSSRRIAS